MLNSEPKLKPSQVPDSDEVQGTFAELALEIRLHRRARPGHLPHNHLEAEGPGNCSAHKPEQTKFNVLKQLNVETAL